MPGHNRKKFLLWYCLLLAAPLLCWSQQKSDPVSIRRVGKELTVTVGQVSSVAGVLRSLCQHLDLQCEIPSVPETQVPVVPMTIQGELSQVLTKLFEGTELNFAAFPVPNRKEPGRILVQVRSRGTASPQPIATARSFPENSIVPSPVAPTATEPEPQEKSSIEREDLGTNKLGGLLTPSQSVSSSAGSFIGTSSVAPPGVPLAGIPLAESPQGLPLPGAPTSAAEATGIPLPGIPASSTGAPGPPLP